MMLSTRAKWITAIAGAGTAVFGLIVATAAASAVIEPFWYASRAFVREYVQVQSGQLMMEQRDHRALLYDLRRGQIEREVIDLERRENRSENDELRLRRLRHELEQLGQRERK